MTSFTPYVDQRVFKADGSDSANIQSWLAGLGVSTLHEADAAVVGSNQLLMTIVYE